MSTPTREIPIDEALRAFFDDVNTRLEKHEAGEADALPPGEDAVRAPGVHGGWSGPDRLRFFYAYEGRQWGFTVTPMLVSLLAAGDLETFPMEDLGSLDPEADAGGEDDVPDALMAAIASMLGGGGGDGEPEPESDPVDDLFAQIAQARRFLDLMLSNEAIELVEGSDTNRLTRGLVPFLEGEGRSYARAEALIDWLIEQEEVDEVFLSEEDLAKVLKNW